jgi:cytosine/uracil/thiamine/allantoin permease
LQCGFVQFTGAILGCMLCDFFLLRLRTIPLAQLYEPSGPFRYTYGFNLIGMGSMLLAVGPCLPGLLAKLSAEDSVAVLEGWLGGNHDAALLFSGLYDHRISCFKGHQSVALRQMLLVSQKTDQ